MSKKVIHRDGTIYYYENNLLHRDSGPAKISTYIMEWWKEGEIHREDGPAVTYNHPTEGYVYMWFIEGDIHREYAPAIIISDLKYHDLLYHGYPAEPHIVNYETDEVMIWHINNENISADIKRYMDDGKLNHNYLIWTNKEKAFFKLKFM